MAFSKWTYRQRALYTHRTSVTDHVGNKHQFTWSFNPNLSAVNKAYLQHETDLFLPRKECVCDYVYKVSPIKWELWFSPIIGLSLAKPFTLLSGKDPLQPGVSFQHKGFWNETRFYSYSHITLGCLYNDFAFQTWGISELITSELESMGRRWMSGSTNLPVLLIPNLKSFNLCPAIHRLIFSASVSKLYISPQGGSRDLWSHGQPPHSPLAPPWGLNIFIV